MIKLRRPMFEAAAVVALLLVTASAATAVPALAAGTKGPSCGDSWKNRAGGTWSTGSDWSTGTPPTASQNACITIALTAPVELSGASTARSLTLGGQSGKAELVDDNQVLSLGSSSAIGRTGEFVAEGGGSNAIALRSGAALSNNGTVEVESGSVLQLSGHVTNAPDGWTGVTGTLAIDTGRFTNSGEVSVQPGGYVEAPYQGMTGAVIDNAAGAIQNQGFLYLGRGATFDQGAGEVIGAAAQIGTPSSGGSLHLTGGGAGRFVLGASATMSGNIAAGQTVIVDGTGSTAPAVTGSFTNNGTLMGGSGGVEFTLPAGDTLTNAGSIVVPSPGGLLTLAGNVVNDGTIAMNGSTLKLAGAVTLTNHGTITVPPQSTLDTGSAGTIDNASGAIASGGLVDVESGGTFVEGAGTTTGNYVWVNGALKLAGSGASSFGLSPGATLSGTIAARQTVIVSGTSGSPVSAAGSFTNHGTVVGSGWLALPAGGTLTNDGTIEDGGPASTTLYLAGNLTNTSTGVIGEEDGTLIMARVGTSFDNAGKLYLLFSQNILLTGAGADICGGSGEPVCDITFDNTGTIYWGTQGGDWGGSDPGSMVQGAKGDEVDLGGTIAPVPDGDPNSWPPPAGDSIGWGITNANYISTTQEWALSCDASVTEGWSMTCPHSGAMLDENGGTTRVPTHLSLTGSGTSRGSSGWTSAYGRPVSLTARVTAQDGSTPTGTVAFYAAEANIGSSSGSDDATAADLAGTVALSTADGVTTATLTYDPPPGQYRLLAIYSGDSAHLPADAGAAGFTAYYATQVVGAQTTGVTVKSPAGPSAFGSPVTFTATVTADATGPAKPTGVITFYDAGVPFGTVPVSTAKGVTAARITFDGLPAGSDAITATYSGDYNYAAATTSSSLSKSVTAPSAPGEVTTKGPSKVRAGGTYKATSTTRGTGAVLFSLASTPAPPMGMTINPGTGAVSYKIPKKGTSRFSFAVVASNAAGQAASAKVQVKVS
jgi:hypothetical protein